MKSRILLVVVMFVGLFSSVPVASGADKRIQVEASATQSVITALLDKSKKAEIQLKDGTKLSGTVIGASAPGLLLEVKKRVQAVPYDQLSTVRLDLGPRRDWEALGLAAGFVGGIAGGIRLGFGGHGEAAELASVVLVVGGPIIGAKLLGHFHRKWLIIEVR